MTRTQLEDLLLNKHFKQLASEAYAKILIERIQHNSKKAMNTEYSGALPAFIGDLPNGN